MTEEQFNELMALLKSMDWKLWEIHTSIKNVLGPEIEESNDNDH